MLSRWLRHRPHWALQRDGIPQPPAVDTRFDAAPWRRVQQAARLPTCMNPLNTAQAITASGEACWNRWAAAREQSRRQETAMGTVAKVSATTSSLAHREGATMGDWQLRWPGGAATGCVSMVVRVLWS